MKYLSLSIVLFWIQTAYTQNTFFKTFDYSSVDEAISLIEVNDGYVIATGCEYVEGVPTPPMLIKVDKQGGLMWTCNPDPIVYFSDFPITTIYCCLAPDNTILVSGRIAVNDSILAVFVCKVSQQGEIIWNKRYKESIWFYETYFINQIATWSNGDFVVAGIYNKIDQANNIYPDSMFLFKCNAEGELLLENKINYPPVLYAAYWAEDNGSIVVFPDGDIFCCYYARWDTRQHPILNRLDSNLQLKWQKEATVIGRSYELAMASDGNILMYVEGGYNNYPWGSDPIVQKLTPDGDSLWTYSPPGINTQLCHDMSTLTNGNIVFTGMPNDYEHLRCISPNGQFLWLKKYHVSPDNPNDRLRFQRIMGTSDGGMLVAGYQRKDSIPGDGILDYDILLLKLDSTGCLTPDCDTEYYLVDAKEPPDDNPMGKPVYFWLRTNLPRPDTPLEVQLGEGFEEGRLRLFSPVGRLLSESEVQENSQAQIPIQSFSPGVYLIVLEGKNGALQTEKVLITF